MEPERQARAVLRRARRAAGLSQSQLAALAGTSQPAIAAYEAGTREPTLPVLERMVRATGYRINLSLEREPALFTLADLATEIRAVGDEGRALRLVFEFLRGADEGNFPIRLLVAAEPGPAGDRRFDAMIGAIAEHLCVHAGITPPVWCTDASRFLHGLWWVSGLRSARARALVHTPASFRRRGVMLDRHDMSAA